MLKKLYYWFHRKTSKLEERGEYSSGLWQDKVRKEALKLCRDSRGRLLEVGCGEGLFLVELASVNKDMQIYGIDNWPEILKKADKRIKAKGIKNVRLSLAEAISLPFKDSYFDIVVCINVIFNLDSLGHVKEVLKEIARVCKKGGKIIFDFRNRKNPFLYFKYKLAPFYDQTVKDLPLKTYKLEEIRLLLENLGLKIKRQTTVGFPIKIVAPIIILELEKR